MEDQRELPFEFPDDLFSESPQTKDLLTHDGLERRLERAHNEWTHPTYGNDGTPQKASLESAKVELDIGKLRHGSPAYQRKPSKEWRWSVKNTAGASRRRLGPCLEARRSRGRAGK